MYPRTATPENPWTQEEIREFRVRAGLPPEEQPWELPPPAPPLWPTVLGFWAFWWGCVLVGLCLGGLHGALLLGVVPVLVAVWIKIMAAA